MSQKSVGYVQLEWTCPNCQTRNPGPQKICSSCGMPQPEDVEFEQPAQEKLITEESELAQAKAGPDVHCYYCGSRNPAGSEVCTQCGASLSEASARSSGQVMGAHRSELAEKVACPACGTLNEPNAPMCVQCGASLSQPKPEPASVSAPSTPAKKGRVGMLGGIGVIILLLLVCAGCITFFTIYNRTEDTLGRVQSVSWTRHIVLEELRPVTREDWRDEIPAGAVIGTCTQKVRRTQDEPAPQSEEVCGTPYTIDEGSGYGQVVQDCQYRVYESWCEYNVDEWQEVDQISLSGNDFNPRWPTLNLRTDQREGEREEIYKIVFNADGETYTYQTGDANLFTRCQIGSRWILKVNTFNTVVSIEPAS